MKEKPLSNEQKDPQPKKPQDQINDWFVIGAGLGIAFGIIFDNLPIGISIGAALGLVFGAAFSQKNKK